MTRPQLCGRLAVAREALDLLWSQVHADGQAPYAAIGALTAEVAALKGQLRTMDATWPHGVLGNRAAQQRLQAAHADLAEVAREIALDGARAMSNRAAHHRALALEESARIRDRAELNRVPPDELLELAPDTARELSHRGGTE